MLTKVMSVTQFRFRVVLKSFYNILSVGCIDKSRNIPGLKQRNIQEHKNPSMKSEPWNPHTPSRVGT